MQLLAEVMAGSETLTDGCLKGEKTLLGSGFAIESVVLCNPVRDGERLAPGSGYASRGTLLAS